MSLSSPITDLQGSIANKTGNRLQDFTDGLILEAGYTYVKRELFPAMRFMQQAIYTNEFYLERDIFGKKRHCDFILYHPTKHQNDMVIECKWQQSRGSV